MPPARLLHPAYAGAPTQSPVSLQRDPAVAPLRYWRPPVGPLAGGSYARHFCVRCVARRRSASLPGPSRPCGAPPGPPCSVAWARAYGSGPQPRQPRLARLWRQRAARPGHAPVFAPAPADRRHARSRPERERQHKVDLYQAPRHEWSRSSPFGKAESTTPDRISPPVRY